MPYVPVEVKLDASPPALTIRPEQLTPSGLGVLFAPHASSALRRGLPEIRSRVIAGLGPIKGRLAWAGVAAGLSVLSRPDVMAWVVKVVIELLLGGLSPWVSRFVDPVVDAALAFIGGTEPTVNPTVKAYAEAVRGLLQTKAVGLSEAARYGLAYPVSGDGADAGRFG